MAIAEENGSGMVMPVQPMNNYGYPMAFGNNSGLFGGSDGWLGILFLIALLNGGMWGGFGGMGAGMWGMNGFGLGYDFPWLLNGQNGINNNVSDGFRTAQLSDGITSIRDGISGLSTQLCNCCGDMQMSMANGFAGVNTNLSNGFANTNLAMCNGFNGVNNSIFGAQTAISQQLNSNELASLNRSFAEQTANTAGFTGVNSGIADLRYTVAQENCFDRQALSEGVRDIIANQTVGFQSIKDQLCQDKIDAKNEKIAELQNQINMQAFRESQTVQNAYIAQNFTTGIDALYNRLATCPVNTVPVYGPQPVFTCPNSYNNCGCGCNG